jgi:GNAT superfamily N-acetyltransferase
MIVKAQSEQNKQLTELSNKSKMFWNYSEKAINIFRDELNISPEYIKKNEVWIYIKDKKIIGYYSLKYRNKELKFKDIVLEIGYWLDHMFILPEFIGQGYGKILFNHFNDLCLSKNVSEIMILADPNSKLFYEKMGCKYINEYPSSIPNRTTPYLL